MRIKKNGQYRVNYKNPSLRITKEIIELVLIGVLIYFLYEHFESPDTSSAESLAASIAMSLVMSFVLRKLMN